MWRVDGPVDHRRGHLEVVGPGREQPRAAVLRHHPQLCDDVLAGVLDGKVGPEIEAADCAELGRVVEDAAADPGDLVEPVFVRRTLVPQSLEVRAVMESVTDPCPGARGDDLREHGPVPELDRPLVWLVVAQIAQPDDGGTDEAAAGATKRSDEAPDERRFEVDVVVQEQDIRGNRQREERLTMFSEATAG